MSTKKPVSAAQKAATKRFEDKNYDKILLRLQKESLTSKESIQKHAERAGESVNGYITKAIEHRIKSELAPEQPTPDSSAAHEQSKSAAAPNIEGSSIEALDLSIRSFNAAKRAGINTIGELIRYIGSDGCIFDKDGRLYAEYVRSIKEYKNKVRDE